MENYDLFNNNCNHFTEECCKFLVGKNLPSYITGLPIEILKTEFGNLIKPFIDQLTKNVVNDRCNELQCIILKKIVKSASSSPILLQFKTILLNRLFKSIRCRIRQSKDLN